MENSRLIIVALLHAFGMKSGAWRNLNPLLSEFSGSWFVRRRTWGFPFSIYVAVWMVLTLVVLYCAYRANADVLRATVFATLKAQSSSNGVPVTSSMTAGYLAEPNHGLFYLIFVPGCALLAYWSVSRYQSVLRQMAREKVLLPDEERKSTRFASPQARNFDPTKFRKFIEKLSDCNERWFKPLPIALFVLALAFNAYREAKTWTKLETLRGGTGSFGYMQAPIFPKWAGEFEQRTTNGEKLEKIDGPLRDELDLKIRDALVKDPAIATAWAAHQIISEPGWDSAQVPTVEVLRATDTKINLEKAMETGLLSLKVTTSGGTRSHEMGWFSLFFFGVLVLESSFHAFAAWIALKYIFWLVTIRRLLPSNPSYGWSLSPNFDDKAMQFGFTELHSTYNTILYAVVLCAFALIVQRANISGRVVEGKIAGGDSASLLIAVGGLLVGIALVIIPPFVNGREMRRLKMQAVSVQHRKIEQAKTKKEMEERTDELRLIEKQSTWPERNDEFKRILIAALFLLVFPLIGLEVSSIPWLSEVSQWTYAADYWKSFVKGTADHFSAGRL